LLFASHLLHEIESITQSFLLICGGRLLANGTAEEVHAMMVGLPNEITLRCTNPQALGACLIRDDAADSVRIADDGLTLTTHQPGRLYEQLPRWVSELGIEILEMRSADESLQALFNSLMKMHRGEL
jgi:ABC-2 type transport system ATP-binding protein